MKNNRTYYIRNASTNQESFPGYEKWTKVAIPGDRSIASYEYWFNSGVIKRENVCWMYVYEDHDDVIFFRNEGDAIWFMLSCL